MPLSLLLPPALTLACSSSRRDEPRGRVLERERAQRVVPDHVDDLARDAHDEGRAQPAPERWGALVPHNFGDGIDKPGEMPRGWERELRQVLRCDVRRRIQARLGR
jgi:hypothetical protein